MTAGRRDQLITIQRGTATLDDYGEETPVVWAALATEWASVFYGKGDERRQAAAEQGRQSATFQVLSNSETRSVTLKDRLVINGWIWDIVGIAPDMLNRSVIEFTATLTGEAWTDPVGEPGQFDFSDPVNSGLLVLLLEDA